MTGRTAAALFLLAAVAPAQTSVTLHGTTYTLQPHPRVFLDGPSGALTTSLTDHSPTGKANANNPPYAVAKSSTDAIIAAGYNYLGSLSGAFNPLSTPPGYQYINCANSALLWTSQGSPQEDPNGYLAYAKRCITHVEEVVEGSLGCDPSVRYCGRSASNDGDWVGHSMQYVALTYSIVRSQLTSSERSIFANKILNDNDTLHGGLDSVACTPQPMTVQAGTLSASVSSPTVTGTGTAFSGFSVGGVLLQSPSINSGATSAIGYISSIGSNSSITLSTNASATYSGGFYYSPPWTAGNCGLIWHMKHVDMAPELTPGQAAYYQSGGTTSSAGPVSNLTIPHVISYFVLGLALADDDQRAQFLTTQAYEYYLTQSLGYWQSRYTGVPEEDSAYPHGRQASSMATMQVALQNGIVNGPNIAGPYMVKRLAQELYLNTLPYSPATQPAWGSPYGSRYNQFSQGPGRFGPLASYLLGNSAEANYLRYYLAQSTDKAGRGDYVNAGELASGHGAFVTYAFLFGSNPTDTSVQSDYRVVPAQFLFRQTDYATCAALGLTCPSEPVYSNMMSKSDWTSAATHVFSTGGWFQWGLDHMLALNTGAVHIFRNVALLAGDGLGAAENYNAGDTFQGGNIQDSVIELGGAQNMGGYGGVSLATYAPVTRWAASDHSTPDAEAVGDSQSRYAYQLIDLTQAYKPAVQPTRVHRHIAHFKAAGTQDYVVIYDDIATGAGGRKKAYWHYFTRNGAATLSTGMLTATLTRPATARLLTAFVATAGANSIAMVDEGTAYPGATGNHNTDRVYTCGSSDGSTCDDTLTAAEWIAVHKPTTNTEDTMPEITQMPASDFRVIQIADAASPKIAAFATGGVLQLSVSFATTHAGIGQYLIGGLAAGRIYDAYRKDDSSTVASQPVADGDNSFYFEGASGNYVVFPQGLANLFIATRPPMQKGKPLQYDFRVTGAADRYVWSVAGGTLPPGMGLSADGLLSGTPSESGDYVVQLRAVDADSPSTAAEASITLSVARAAISTTVSGVGREKAILRYGEWGLDAQARCQISVSNRADFASLAESFSDSGGPAVRQAVLGETAQLNPGTEYYVRADCGAASGTALFTSDANSSIATSIPLSIAAPAALHATRVQVQYGSSKQLGSEITSDCPGSCLILVPAMSRQIVYIKRLFLDSSARVVAQSGVTPIVAVLAP